MALSALKILSDVNSNTTVLGIDRVSDISANLNDSFYTKA